MYFSENLPGVNSVVMIYRIKYIRIGQRGIVLHGQTAFSVIIHGGRKMKNTVWICEATCKGSHGGRLAQRVS